jgi:hypothetical protein
VYPESNRRFTGLDLELGPGAAGTFVVDGNGRVLRLDWTQGGTTTAYARQSEPAVLSLRTDVDSVHLALMGDPGARYEIQATVDFQTWERIDFLNSSATLTVPIALNPQRYFRAMKRPE